jgi:hypothetical protein
VLRTDYGPTGRLTCSSQLGVADFFSPCPARTHTLLSNTEEKERGIGVCALSRRLAVFPKTKTVSPDDSALSCGHDHQLQTEYNTTHQHGCPTSRFRRREEGDVFAHGDS